MVYDIAALEDAMVLIEVRRAGMPPMLAEEIAFYLNGIDRDPEDYPDGYTEVDALHEAYDKLEQYVAEAQPTKEERACVTVMRKAEVALGLAVPKTYMDEHYVQWTARSVYRMGGTTYYWEGSAP